MMRYESPAKRPRMEGDQDDNPYEIVPAIHQAVTTTQRFDVLQRLFSVLNYNTNTRACHSDPHVFKYMIESGVVNALCLQLGFVINRHGSSKEELDLTCTALDIFYRFCPDLVTEQSLRATGPEIFRLLFEAFRQGAKLPVLSIWHSCSSCDFGTSLLLQEHAFLYAIADILRQQMYGEDGLMEVLGLLKNITYYGEDFRKKIIEQPGLLSSLTGIPFSEKIQERFSAVIRNLALSANTRILLAQRADVLTCIVRLCNNANRQTLRNVLNTMISLTMDANSCLLIVFHGDGMLVELLKRYVACDEDPVIRKRSARALRLLARETSVPIMVHDDQLMEILSNRALHDPNSDVRAEAAEAFAKCAGLIKAAMSQHEAVLEALTHLVNSPHVAPDAMARAIKEQTNHPGNRASIARKENLLNALANIGVSKTVSQVTKENVCNTFLDLSSDESNLQVIATPATLQALAHNAGDRTEGHARTREAAVKTLLNLAVLPSNRKMMAKQSTLLQSLLRFAATTVSDDVKREVKSVLLQLAAEL